MKRHLAQLTVAVTAQLVVASMASAQTFEEYRHTVDAPYAGRYEARIGGSSEPEAEKLRLDIGASIDILTLRDTTNLAPRSGATRLSFGADFFTWSRLRSEPNFKFPVEAIDYYFGINAAIRLARIAGHAPLISEVRLRLAHISAHLVDGDRALGDSAWTAPTVYSREFVDAMIAADGERLARAIGLGSASIRPYLGALHIFHTIPSLAAATSPYLGVDGWIEPTASLPFVVRAGYELRVNTELDAAIAEHHARLGLKLGRPHTNGLLLETTWYSGRSMYGQSFGQRESYVSLGFGIDY